MSFKIIWVPQVVILSFSTGVVGEWVGGLVWLVLGVMFVLMNCVGFCFMFICTAVVVSRFGVIFLYCVYVVFELPSEKLPNGTSRDLKLPQRKPRFGTLSLRKATKLTGRRNERQLWTLATFRKNVVLPGKWLFCPVAARFCCFFTIFGSFRVQAIV